MNNRETKTIELLLENQKGIINEEMTFFHIKQLYQKDVDWYNRFENYTFNEYESDITLEVRKAGEFVEEYYGGSEGVALGSYSYTLTEEDLEQVKNAAERLAKSYKERLESK